MVFPPHDAMFREQEGEQGRKKQSEALQKYQTNTKTGEVIASSQRPSFWSMVSSSISLLFQHPQKPL